MVGLEKLGTLKKLGRLGKPGNLRSVPKTPQRVTTPTAQIAKVDPLEERAQQGVVGSLPERIIWKWLVGQRVPFEAQVGFFGGQQIKGGAIVDFFVWGLASRPVCLRIQGSYWHGPMRPDRASQDDYQATRLRERGYIVVDLWEPDVYSYALSGDLSELIRRKIQQAA
jgi:hypothetical protein